MSMLGSFAALMTPDTIGQLSKVVGVNSAQTQKGLDVIGPLLLGSLARKSETIGGMDSIMRLLPENTAPTLLGKLASAAGASPAAAVPGLLTSVLGPGVSTIEKALGGRLGFDATSLLSMAAPALLGVISSTAQKEKLDSADIAKTLQRESSDVIAAAKPEVKAVLTEAFQLGDRAESLKSIFLDDEWKKIRLSPIAATFYVVSASPSGVKGLSKELVAAGDALKELVKKALPSSLVDVALGSYEGKLVPDDGSILDEESPRASMLAVISAAARSVKARRPVDAESYRETIVTLSRRVAEAAKEGGFLGMGGTLVTPEEERAIAEIAEAVA